MKGGEAAEPSPFVAEEASLVDQQGVLLWVTGGEFQGGTERGRETILC